MTFVTLDSEWMKSKNMYNHGLFVTQEGEKFVWRDDDIHNRALVKICPAHCEEIYYKLTNKKLDIKRLSLAGEKLDKLRLTNLDAQKSCFSHARLIKARFVRCDFRDADFTHSNLWLAEFFACDLRGAKFVGADVSGCEFPFSVTKHKLAVKNGICVAQESGN